MPRLIQGVIQAIPTIYHLKLIWLTVKRKPPIYHIEKLGNLSLANIIYPIQGLLWGS